ncbi:radical SAM protein, partial [bacterium]|nr:radical SAM protein [bacterium]
MSNNSNIMPFIHLPIQSGDEDILLKMNRKMKISEYLEYISYIKNKIPNVAISTDLIVGFPNESEQAFNNTLKLYEAVQFDNAYTFIYSKRDG